MYNPQLTVDRIKEACETKGISLTQLSEACGLNKNTIAVSANSKTGLSAKILTDLSKYLGCSSDYLLGKTDDPKKTEGNDMTPISSEMPASEDEQLLEMIKSLNLLERSKIIVMIDEMKSRK